MRRLVVAPIAARDIDRALIESLERHGAAAAGRYRRLIALAIRHLLHDPMRLASKSAEFGELRLYALRFASPELRGPDRVRSPAHLIVYRHDEARVEVVRFLHEAMDLPRHLR
ncbi:MAG: hypothetical protein JWM33_246 [Caulobacteraceae bacterium]|nr:hypothetical protein [Caulobacteraceae bacterium]